MREDVVLITGAAGEIGHALIERISADSGRRIVTIDLKPLDASLRRRVVRSFIGSILEEGLLETILAEFAVGRIYHLAALLSTRAEFTPLTAHQVNVEGTLKLLEFAQSQSRSHGRSVKFFYPSSIAAYGIDPAKKYEMAPLKEHMWNLPITMYGANKLYCEHLGRYYSHHYRQLDVESQTRLDFRSIRFPGLISAETVPHGGTTDYAPEMVHAAASGDAYRCFVTAATRAPFMAMPDAIDAIDALMATPIGQLSQPVYNVSAFAPSADEFRSLVLQSFPNAQIGFAEDGKRQQIIDSWPAEVDCSAAQSDWNFNPRFDLQSAFSDYLVPSAKSRYE